MDDLEAVTNESLEYFSYNWLINNYVFPMPEIFVKNYPELFKNTNYWYATRDAYFSVRYNSEPAKRFLSGSLSMLHSALFEAFMPGSCMIGSMYNRIDKSSVISTAIVLLSPQNYDPQLSDSNWLEKWSYRGPFEAEVYRRIVKYEEQVIAELADYLQKIYKFDETTSTKIARSYTRDIVDSYIMTPREAVSMDMLFKAIDENKLLDGFREIKSSHLSWDNPSLVGYLVQRGSDFQVYQYFQYLYIENDLATANEMYEILAASDRLSAIIDIDKTFHYQPENSTLGFGKNPLMYAVQHNYLKTYEHLKMIYPELINASTDFDVSCGPSIGGRTLLTYALENSEDKVINQVINDVAVSLLLRKDTADRNVLYYLSQNENITDKTKKEYFGKLLQKAPSLKKELPRASFDCSKSGSSTEMLICSNEKYSTLDKAISNIYVNLLRSGNNTESIKKSQIAWNKNREECIDNIGFEACYERRIKELEGIGKDWK